MTSTRAKYAAGALVCHKLFDYWDVVIDIDPEFQGTAEWYEAMARSRPPKDRPWYHVLVDGAEHNTYVAERNLEPASDVGPIHHHLLEEGLMRYENGRYRVERKLI